MRLTDKPVFAIKTVTIWASRSPTISEPVTATLWEHHVFIRILAIIALLIALSQPALAVVENHDYWENYLLLPPLSDQSNQYLSFNLPAEESFLAANGSTHKIADSKSFKKQIPINYARRAKKTYTSRPNGLDERLLYVIDAFESLGAKSLELHLGEAVLSSPSFYSNKSPELRFYSTSVEWKNPLYPEPVKFVLSVHRDRTVAQRSNTPSAMIIMYTNNDPTKERTIIGYGRYGVYGSLTLLWKDSAGLPGTSFLQFGVAYDSPKQFQPFYDPDLKELTFYHRGQWIAAGWRASNLSSLKMLVKYFYYTLVGE